MEKASVAKNQKEIKENLRDLIKKCQEKK